MSSKLSIAKDLRPLLLAKSSLNALVDQNIFPLYATGDPRGDFILYQRTDGGSITDLMGVTDEWCDVTFNAVSESYERSIEIAEALRSVLQDITINGDPLILDNAREDYVGEGNVIKCVQVLVFSVGPKPRN